MRRTLTLVLVACVLAACGSSKNATSATTSTPGSSAATGSAPRFDVVLDDNGLTFPPGPTMAATYLVSFEDRRTAPPAGQKLHLQFIVPGPQLLLFDVSAGTSSTHTLLANMTPEVVSLDPGSTPRVGMLRPDDLARRHSIGDVHVTNPLDIVTTPEFPTPVT